MGERGQKILVVGGGGREHAIVRKLKESENAREVICAPGNGGISLDAECFPVKATDTQGIVRLAREEAVDVVFVAPDDPLAMGMVDALEQNGMRAFGPRQSAARIESSKVFAKNLMKKYRIPTADFAVFDDAGAAFEYIALRDRYPVVVKADGLALGKGVIIAQDFGHAKRAVEEIMLDRVFGESGSKVVIEEYITGPEVSVLALCDGKTVLPLISAMDHKRALDGDRGLNTGGMGTIAPNPCYTPETAARCMKEIFLPTVKAMREEGCPFKGCLFFGLMLTDAGPRVIEYNARFGDPETQVVLPLLETDFLELVNAVIDGTLDKAEPRFKDESAACVVMASGGYPLSYETGYEISGLDENGQLGGAEIFHAGTRLKDGRLYTGGGRVLGVTALGEDTAAALERAYGAVAGIRFEGAYYRRDIGRRS